jgi:hypothetical protein
MQFRADALWKGVMGGVADQQVTEAKCLIAGH